MRWKVYKGSVAVSMSDIRMVRQRVTAWYSCATDEGVALRLDGSLDVELFVALFQCEFVFRKQSFQSLQEIRFHNPVYDLG